MRTVGIVIRARRDQLDRVGAEHGQVADVLLPEREIPAVVRIRLGSIAELMAANGVLGGGSNAEIVGKGYLASSQMHFAQQPADAKQHSARIVADNKHR